MAETQVFSYGASAETRLEGSPWYTGSVIDECNMRMEH